MVSYSLVLLGCIAGVQSSVDEIDYVSTFLHTGCPNVEPDTNWWRGQDERTVFEDMYKFCKHARDGTGKPWQRKQCCGGGHFSCVNITCTEQKTERNPDEAFRNYSSIYGNDAKGTGHAQSKLNSAQAWSAAKNEIGEYMTIDLGNVMVVYGVVTQGRKNCLEIVCNQVVTSYKLSHSEDGEIFAELPPVFAGNTVAAADAKVTNFFEPVNARYVRFIVQEWHVHISMKAAVKALGICSNCIGEQNEEVPSGNGRRQDDWGVYGRHTGRTATARHIRAS